jgi:hypothetical protein
MAGLAKQLKLVCNALVALACSRSTAFPEMTMFVFAWTRRPVGCADRQLTSLAGYSSPLFGDFGKVCLGDLNPIVRTERVDVHREPTCEGNWRPPLPLLPKFYQAGGLKLAERPSKIRLGAMG